MTVSFKKIRYMAEAALLAIVMLLFKLLPLDMASGLGGALARFFGPFLRAHRIANANLKHVFPHYSNRERRIILTKMWDNLGRVAGEYPHLQISTMRKRVTIEGAHHLERLHNEGTGAVFVSGHFANWELCPLLAMTYALPSIFIYREANNPYAEKLIRYMRKDYRNAMFGKGRESAQKAIRSLHNNHSVSMLVDQKLNEGVDIPFFGIPAKTSISATRFALKYRVPIIAVRIVRTDGAHFHVTIHPPQMIDPTLDAAAAMEKIHHCFESWIRDCPEQWFWVHNRWNWKREEL